MEGRFRPPVFPEFSGLPVEHVGAEDNEETAVWLAEVKPVFGPQQPVDEYAGFWEVIYGAEVQQAPSLVELVTILSQLRSQVAEVQGTLRIELYWRTP